MAFFDFRPSGAPNPAYANAAPDAPSPVQTADALRRRARHRLIGAAILLLAGIILFPLLLDAPPRPVSSNMPILVGDRLDQPAMTKATTAPAAMPAAVASKEVVETGKSLSEGEEMVQSAQKPAADRGATAPSSAAPAAAKVLAGAAVAAAGAKAVQTIRNNPPGAKAVSAPAPASVAASSVAAAQADADARQKAAAAAREQQQKQKAALKARQEREARQRKADEERKAAQARLDREIQSREAAARAADKEVAVAKPAEKPVDTKTAKPADKPAVAYNFPDTGRFVVQVGASVDEAQVARVRSKLSAAGLNNYTQVVKIDGKDATRVRMGPFKTRKEMERVAAKVKALGLPVSMYSY